MVEYHGLEASSDLNSLEDIDASNLTWIGHLVGYSIRIFHNYP